MQLQVSFNSQLLAHSVKHYKRSKKKCERKKFVSIQKLKQIAFFSFDFSSASVLTSNSCFQMASHLYWFLYRRRNKVLITLLIIIGVFLYLFRNDTNLSKATEQFGARAARYIRSNARINRNTYTTPQSCQGCPGENGQGVALTVCSTER